jgi:single-stranded-DNA-specific exonuclease
MSGALETTRGACVLGVERSLTGRRWVSRLADERVALALAQRLGVPEIVGRVLSARGVTFDEAERFLNPTLRDLLPEPLHLKGMVEAVERLSMAVVQGERIAVFGDYDVDGAASAALLLRFLGAVDGRPRVYVPDRLSEGYGPNTPALLRLRAEGVSLVLTVDCGTLAFEALEEATNAGLDVIVVDHHVAEPRLPRAVAVVNPNRLDETTPHRQLAAVGVAFLLVVALNRALRQAGWYAARPEPNLMAWLDLVALATVCDVVPLTGLNRALVTQGLKVMARRGNLGLAALADVAGLSEPPGAYHLGFVLGPRVNAGGRVGQSDLGARLLASDDPVEATELARRLDTFNRERQELEAAVLAEATAGVEAESAVGSLVFAAGAGWHPGVVGIVASRLVERYGRPACVLGLAGGIGVGSGRSINGIDLGAAVIAARQAGLLIKGGGHAMAAGFTVEEEKLATFRAFLEDRIGAAVPEGGLVRTLYLDGALSPEAVSAEFVATLEKVGPFGSGNAEPRFVVPNATFGWVDVAGEAHVRCSLTGPEGKRLKGIAFRCLDGPLGPALLKHDGAAFHVAGRLRADTFRGNGAVQLLIDDAAPAV